MDNKRQIGIPTTVVRRFLLICIVGLGLSASTSMYAKSMVRLTPNMAIDIRGPEASLFFIIPRLGKIGRQNEVCGFQIRGTGADGDYAILDKSLIVYQGLWFNGDETILRGQLVNERVFYKPSFQIPTQFVFKLVSRSGENLYELISRLYPEVRDIELTTIGCDTAKPAS